MADLTARLEAADRYRSLRHQQRHDARMVSAAGRIVALQRSRGATAADTVRVARTRVRVVRRELSELAVAAYTGSADVPAGSSDAGRGGPHGAEGQEADDASVMVAVIFRDQEQDVVRAQDGVTRARSEAHATIALVAAAHGVLATDLQALAHTVRAEATAAAVARSAIRARMVSPRGPTVLGPARVGAAELAGWYASTGERADTTVPMGTLAGAYIDAGRATGVRADIAFAQSVVETGYFSFPPGGQLVGRDNNYAGIGACDSCAHGWSFPTAGIGVGTQLELLEAYATIHPRSTPLLHGHLGVGGCCSTWMSLSGHWASNPAYGVEILRVYDLILRWALPRRLAAVGLH